MRISDLSSDVCSSDLLLDPNARETYWARAYVAPSFAKGGDGAVAATAVMRELLAAEPAGFLQRDLIALWYLVEHLGVAYPGAALGCDTKSSERRVGKECVSTSRSPWSLYH